MSKLDNIKLPENIREITKDSIQKGRSIKNQKSKKLKNTLVASITFVLIVGSMVISSDTTLAYIKNITKQIESFLSVDDNSLDQYKSNVNQTIKTKGIKFTLGDVMLDDKKLIFSIHMDYKNFKFKSNTSDPNKYELMPNIPDITINNVTFANQSGSFDEEIGELEKDMFFEVDLFEIDTNRDGMGDTPYDILNEIKPNKDYDLNIKFDDLIYTYIYDGNSSSGDVIPINLNFNTKINASNIIKDTKIENINKQFDIDEKGREGILDIQEIRISPVSVKLKYTFKPDSGNPDSYSPDLVATDNKGQELISDIKYQFKDNVWVSEFKLTKSHENLIFRPCVFNEKSEKFIPISNYSFEVEMPK